MLDKRTESKKKEGLFPIYYSDLNEGAKKRLLHAMGIDDPSEMNWDDEIDICPLAYYPGVAVQN